MEEGMRVIGLKVINKERVHLVGQMVMFIQGNGLWIRDMEQVLLSMEMVTNMKVIGVKI